MCQVIEWRLDVCNKPARKRHSKSRDSTREVTFLQSCNMHLMQRTEEKPVRGLGHDKTGRPRTSCVCRLTSLSMIKMYLTSLSMSGSEAGIAHPPMQRTHHAFAASV